MKLARLIPVLLLYDGGLVKTERFLQRRYLGDPRNAVKIFNEKEVDELVLLDIRASVEGVEPDFALVAEVVSEAFMPIAFGGGLRTVAECARVLQLGVEKVVLNTMAVERPAFVQEAAAEFGSQSVVLSIDARRRVRTGNYDVYTRGGRQPGNISVVEHALRGVALGAGEIFINSVDRDGTMQGYDLPLVSSVTRAVGVPVVACGGAGTLAHCRSVVFDAGASGAAAGSIFVYHGRHKAVLISYPERSELARLFAAG